MGKPQVNKWSVLPPLFIISLSETQLTVAALFKASYIEASIAGVMGFVWFHLGMVCLKHGVQPWRVVPALMIASVAFAARSIEMTVAGQGLAAIMPALASIVWGIAARKSNQVRKAIEAESNAR